MFLGNMKKDQWHEMGLISWKEIADELIPQYHRGWLMHQQIGDLKSFSFFLKRVNLF